MRQERIHDALDGRDGECQRRRAQDPRAVEPDQPTRRVDQRSSGEAVLDHDVALNVALDFTSAGRAPLVGQGIDHA